PKQLLFGGGAAAIAGWDADAASPERLGRPTTTQEQVAWDAFVEGAAKAAIALAEELPAPKEFVLSGRLARVEPVREAIRRRFSCKLASRRARPLACDAVAYVASFENHPHALRALTRGRVLWGNGPGVVTRARDPLRALEQLNPRTLPRTLSAPPPREEQRSVRWLVKPRASGGGTGIRGYQPGAPVPHGSYVQEQLAGVAGSVVFAAAAGGGRGVPRGVS